MAPSDHKLLSLSIKNLRQIPKNKSYTLNRRLAKKITETSLRKSTTVSKFLKVFLRDFWSSNSNKYVQLKYATQYKSDTQDIFDRNEMNVMSIREELTRRWMNTWEDIGRIRFSERQKVAFQKIKIITKYNLMDKADGSIVNKLCNETGLIVNQDEVNQELKITLQELCGDAETEYFRPMFPKLDPITPIKLKSLWEIYREIKLLPKI